MKVSTNLKRLLFCALFFIISMLIIFFNINTFLIDDEPLFYNEPYIGYCSILILLTSILILLKFDFTEKVNNVLTVIFFLLTPFFIFFTVELFNDRNIFLKNDLKKLTNLLILLNFMIIYVFHFLLFAITNNFKLSSILSILCFNLLSIANYFVTLFRGQPLVPWDIYSVRTALSVASGFEASFTPYFALGIFTIIFVIALISKFNFKLKINKKNIIMRIAIIIISIVLIVTFYSIDIIELFNINVGLWAPINEYHNNGFLVSFFKQSRNLFMSKPEGYSSLSLKNSYSQTSNNMEIKNAPNIIVVMNESFSDLSALGEIETTENYIPFYHSIKDNCIKGNLHVSVFGGRNS